MLNVLYHASRRTVIMAIGVNTCGIKLFGFGPVESKHIQLTVVYNNLPFNTHSMTAWGFSFLIEGKAQTILFDTGGNIS